MGEGIIKLKTINQLSSQEQKELGRLGVNTRILIEYLDYIPVRMPCATEQSTKEKAYSQND